MIISASGTKAVCCWPMLFHEFVCYNETGYQSFDTDTIKRNDIRQLSESSARRAAYSELLLIRYCKTLELYSSRYGVHRASLEIFCVNRSLGVQDRGIPPPHSAPLILLPNGYGAKKSLFHVYQKK